MQACKEDSGIDSDSRSGNFLSPVTMDISIEQRSSDSNHDEVYKFDKNVTEESEVDLNSCIETRIPVMKHKSTSLLQKRLERQILQAKKFRLKEQNLEGLAKKLIPRSRLSVPNTHFLPVSKTDSHPLISWESESEDDLSYHPISVKEISDQLLKDGYHLDLTPDDEDLDLIPPKPLSQRCICCSLNCMCMIQ